MPERGPLFFCAYGLLSLPTTNFYQTVRLTPKRQNVRHRNMSRSFGKSRQVLGPIRAGEHKAVQVWTHSEDEFACNAEAYDFVDHLCSPKSTHINEPLKLQKIIFIATPVGFLGVLF